MKKIDELREYLLNFELLGQNHDERVQYLDSSLERFIKTIELLPDSIPSGGSVLECGASPYFMTLLLEKEFRFKVETANYFGSSKKMKMTDFLKDGISRKKRGIKFSHFNVEYDSFPYKSGTFDLAFFCEIIEHLPSDPVHPIAEINRLLKPGGYIIITTPNALRYENIIKLAMGKNIYDHYSGYGAYGRHNREYTPAELSRLVESLGFKVERCFTESTADINLRGIKRFRRLIRLLTTKNRGGNIFLLAKKINPAKPVYSSWLFASVYDDKKKIKK